MWQGTKGTGTRVVLHWYHVSTSGNCQQYIMKE